MPRERAGEFHQQRVQDLRGSALRHGTNTDFAERKKDHRVLNVGTAELPILELAREPRLTTFNMVLAVAFK